MIGGEWKRAGGDRRLSTKSYNYTPSIAEAPSSRPHDRALRRFRAERSRCTESSATHTGLHPDK